MGRVPKVGGATSALSKLEVGRSKCFTCPPGLSGMRIMGHRKDEMKVGTTGHYTSLSRARRSPQKGDDPLHW